MLDPELGLKGVSLRAPELPPLAPLDLEVGRGEHVALLEAGDGAAFTLLRIAAGFERPDIGRVIFAGRDLTDRPPADRPTRWVPTGLALFATATVLDNLAFALPAEIAERRERRARALDLLARHGLAGLAERRPNTLAPTEAARVALLRALAGRPAVLLLDRPFLGAPVGERRALRDAFDAMRRDAPCAVLERCDDPREALAHADRVALFEADRLLQLDTPDRIWSHPASPAAAVLAGEADLLPGRLLGLDGGFARVETPIGEVRGVLREVVAPGEAVVVGFRPERVDLTEAAAADPRLGVRFEADFVERRLEGAAVRLVFTVGGQRLVVSRPERGLRGLALAGRTALAVEADDVWIHRAPRRPS
ncbi:MAG: ABC transporter ATP-binding protein [Hyphomicrobiales bacterium]|nr:ABC transporter ATP-binding protein [Hyphomicrobiales bacterium]